MNIQAIAVGRLKPGIERDHAARYLDRSLVLGRGQGLPVLDLIELPESRARRAADRQAEEGAAILAKLPNEAAVITFDERGRSDLASEAIAGRIGRWRDEGRSMLAMVIGGPDGLNDSVRSRADLILAFGAATLPHGLVRVLVFEQMYRTLTILAGHPYHRGEA